MLKRKIDSVLNNWLHSRKQALMITGARQVGKTYSIMQFIKKNFKYIIHIDFSKDVELIDTFVNLHNSEDLLLKLSAIKGELLKPNKTVIFFDEIQIVYKRRETLIKIGKLDSFTQDLVSSLKSGVEQGEYRFILSGSLLGVTLNNILLNPTGYLDTYFMYPLDFEEFLMAKHVGKTSIDYLRECFFNEKPVDEEINKLFLSYFKEYVLIGGMPEAVDTYFKTKNLYNVQLSQEQILNVYEKDIFDYITDSGKKLRIKNIYQSIPSQLNCQNKKFILSEVIDKNYLKSKKIDDEFLWLTNAYIALPVYNVNEPSIPLTLNSERRNIKLFMNDIGLLDAALFSTGIRKKILNNEATINFGAPYENVVAEILWANGFNDKVFYYSSKKHGEIDFVVEYKGEILPIEIKSGKPSDMTVYNHTALNNVLKIYPIKKAYIFGNSNVIKANDKIVQLPIYMVTFLKNKD